MTGRELIEYIQRHKLEDCVVEVQYRDDGGYYFGTDPEPILYKIEALEDDRWAYTMPFDRLIL